MDPSNQEENIYNPLGSQDNERPINWRKYIFLFLTNWYWFLITIFVSVSIAYVKNRYTLPSYTVTATLLIENEEEIGDIISEIRSVRRSRRRIDMANEMAKLRAFSLHRRTVDSLGWNIFWIGHGRVAMKRPLYKYPPYSIEIDSLSQSWYLNQTFFVDGLDDQSLKLYNNNGIDTIINTDQWIYLDGWTFRFTRNSGTSGYASYSFIIYNPNTLAKQYLSKVNIASDENQGTVIKISSAGPLFDKESDYINSLSKNYIYSGLERKRLIAENTLEFVNDQLSVIRDSLRKIERQLLAFRLNTTVIDLSREGQQAYDKLQTFYIQKTELKLKSNYYDYLKEYIESKRDPQAIISPILLDAKDQMLINQVNSLQMLYEERELLSFSASVENPSLAQLNSRIQNSRDKILEIVDGLIYNNKLAWRQIDIEEEHIEDQLLQLPVSEQELLNYQRKYEVINQFYKFLLEKRAEAGIQKASTVSAVRILDEASTYTISTTGTKQSLLYLIALVLGLVAPMGIIFFVDYFDNRIKDQNDVEDNTQLPILGVVSHNITKNQIPVYEKPGSAFSESFRHIRTNLQYYLREPEKKVIMISSTISGEGKTFIAMNLATILAMNNKKVLICGFDLRRPSIHKIFNINNNAGISTYFAGKSSLEEIIHNTNIDGLDAMIAGPTPPNPAELLETDQMKHLMENVSEIYDYIVIDTPPIALVTDALLISKYSHANIFIIRQNFTPKGILELINKLELQQIKGVSLIINDIMESKAFGYRYYYGYGYSYNYQYKYGYKYYHEESNKKD